MLTGGNYIQIRQVMLRFATQYRQSIGTHSLKENVESAMNYLSNHGYGTLQDKVFYKNPHLSKEQLKTILVEPKEYWKSASAKANTRHVQKCTHSYMAKENNTQGILGNRKVVT